MTALSIQDLTLRFRGLIALSNLSVSFAPGSIHGLIGPNGAGKTTLINAISGLVAPTAGRIEFAGRDLVGLAPHAIARLGIGRTFQHAEIFADQSPLTNIMTGFDRMLVRGFWHDLAGTPGKRQAERETRARAEALLVRFDIAQYRDTVAADLPFGVLKRIDLARALASQPSVLLMDEPTSGMNDQEARKTIAACRALAREHRMTLIVVEHNMRVIMAMADVVTVLDHGEKIAEGPPAAIQRDPRVIDIYLGRGRGPA
jgi:branched-chain amino acid transport system ATP-binding protein